MKPCPYNPTMDQVILEPMGANPYSKSIISAAGSTPLPNRGLVIAVGPGCFMANGERMPLTCKVGDEVLYHPAAGIQMDRAEHVLLSDKGVLCVVPGGFEALDAEGDPKGPSSLILN